MQNRIAFVLFGHSASTFPLIKRLCSKGYLIDVYNVCFGNLHFIEGFSEVDINTEHSFIRYIPKDELQEVYDYIGCNNFRYFTVRFHQAYEKYPLVNFIIYPYLRLLYFKFCRFINRCQYDLVDIVTRVNVSSNSYLLSNIKAKKVIISLHEVFNHEKSQFNKTIKVPNIYKIVEKKDIDIVVFSNKSYYDILNLGVSSKKILVINFGLFETYASVKPEKLPELPELPDDYILMIGAIKPYKGLRVLYDAVAKCEENGINVNVVVAGFGTDPILKKMEISEHYTILNKYLSSAEFVLLIKKCKYLVCPYLSMSQSGIPQTAFLYNKPIIASDLDGFKEIITHKMNGLLFPVNDSDALFKAITLMESRNNYDMMEEGVSKFVSLNSSYDWNEITNIFITNFCHTNEKI